MAVLVLFVFDEACSITIKAAFAIWRTKFGFLLFIFKIVAAHQASINQASIHLAIIHQAAIHLATIHQAAILRVAIHQAIIHLATIEICCSWWVLLFFQVVITS